MFKATPVEILESGLNLNEQLAIVAIYASRNC